MRQFGFWQNILSDLVNLSGTQKRYESVRFIRRDISGENNTNETWAQPHKALTPLSTQNLKIRRGLYSYIVLYFLISGQCGT